jgi:hypothetical protein
MAPLRRLPTITIGGKTHYWVSVIMASSSTPLNELAFKFVEDVFGFIPIGLIREFAKIRPVQNAGVLKLKEMISKSGFNLNSVLKVKSPQKREHQNWGIAEKSKQLQEGVEFKAPWTEELTVPKFGEESEDVEDCYGVIDGAHRFWALCLLVEDQAFPNYTADFLVPCQIMKNTIPDELVIAIATREF